MNQSDSPLHVTREIPIVWLIGTAFLLVVQAVTLYVGQQTQAEAIRTLSSEVKELAELALWRAKVAAAGVRIGSTLAV